jgi:hypothetical protein
VGRTVPSIRFAIEHEINKTWHTYRRALRKEDRQIFDNLLSDARLHSDASSITIISDLNILILMSIILEQEKRIRSLMKALNQS